MSQLKDWVIWLENCVDSSVQSTWISLDPTWPVMSFIWIWVWKIDVNLELSITETVLSSSISDKSKLSFLSINAINNPSGPIKSSYFAQKRLGRSNKTMLHIIFAFLLLTAEARLPDKYCMLHRGSKLAAAVFRSYLDF